MATLREFIEKFGDQVLDAELSFRVFDGHQNNDYTAAVLDWHAASYFENPEHKSFRFNVGLNEHRLVKERK